MTVEITSPGNTVVFGEGVACALRDGLNYDCTCTLHYENDKHSCSLIFSIPDTNGFEVMFNG